MTCQWHTGLLVVRECGLPASGGCGMCGRTLCLAHTIPGPNGMACPQCASTADGYPENEDTQAASDRNEYYQRYGEGAQFGEPGYFSPADSAALASQSPVLPFRQDGYDPMES
ncbi:MAG: hypothetical protein FJW30_07625 [Acidobacteria bacterium]|nr:hypothetical protein [Acidobacteriota bacterium]